MTKPIHSNESLLSAYTSLKYEKLKQKCNQMNLLSMNQLVCIAVSIIAVATYFLRDTDRAVFYTTEATVLLSLYAVSTNIYNQRMLLMEKIKQSIVKPTINELNEANPQLPLLYINAVINCERAVSTATKMKKYWFGKIANDPKLFQQNAITSLIKLGSRTGYSLASALLPNIFDYIETSDIVKEDGDLPIHKIKLITKMCSESPDTKHMLTNIFNDTINQIINDLKQLTKTYPNHMILREAIPLEINVIRENANMLREELIDSSLKLHNRQRQQWEALVQSVSKP